MVSWNWDEQADSEGVVHQSVANTDHNDATVLKQGYDLKNFSEITPNPNFYVPLHEDSGTTVYDVAGSADGTNNGATVGQQGLLGTTAYTFDGVNDYLDIPSKPLPEDMTQPWTATFWVQDDDPFGQAVTHLLCQADDGSNNFNGWDIRFSDTGIIQLANRDGTNGWSANWNVTASTFSDLTQVGIIYDGSENPSNARLVIDGGSEQAPDSTTNQGASGVITNVNMDIGVRNSGSGWFSGKLSNIATWGTTLTGAQITTRFNVVDTPDDWLGSGKLL